MKIKNSDIKKLKQIFLDLSSKIRKFFLAKVIKSIRLFKHHLDKGCEEEALEIARKPIKIGLKATVFLLGSFMIWGLFFKIDSTAISVGKIILDESKKTIQHLEGGIVEEILVSEGQKVYKGQILVKLSETAAKANQEQLKKQLISLKAAKIRLEAERDGKDILDFSNLVNRFEGDLEITKILNGEKELFLTRKKSLGEKVDILTQKIKQLNEEIAALQSQVESVSQRIALSKNELASLGKLYRERIIPKSRYLEIKRQVAELSGNYGEYLANIAKVKQTITESELQVLNLKTQNNNDIIKDLQDTQTKIVDLEERARASRDILHRTIITAPQDGIINGLKYHTKGGVIPPAGEVMDLIPQDDELIVEVKVNPQDIDVVMNGLPARVHLSAYRSKIVPLLKGKVINVSADSFTEQQTNTSYFLARIRIDKGELKQLDNVSLYPGMPVEAYIITGSRTFFQYLFDPITVSMRRALREE